MNKIFEVLSLLRDCGIAILLLLVKPIGPADPGRSMKDSSGYSNRPRFSADDSILNRSRYDAFADEDDISSPEDDMYTDPSYSFLSGNIYHHEDSHSHLDDLHHFPDHSDLSHDLFEHSQLDDHFNSSINDFD